MSRARRFSASAPPPHRARGPGGLLALLILLAWGTVHAATRGPEEEFDHAARLHEQGEHRAAVEAYDRVLAAGMVTPSVLFNQGNAWVQDGQIGHAIACYRRARDLAPRDTDLRANLNFARSKVPDEVRFRGGVPRRALDLLSPREWTWLVGALAWSWAAVLIARTLRPALAARSRGIAWTLGVATVLAAFAAFQAVQIRRDSAVVVQSEVTARFGPLEEAQPAFQLPNGAEVRILDRKDRWLKVRDHASREAWIQESAAVILFP